MTGDIPAYKLKLCAFHALELKLICNIADSFKAAGYKHFRLVFDALVANDGGAGLPSHTDPYKRIFAGVFNRFPFAFFFQIWGLFALKAELSFVYRHLSIAVLLTEENKLKANIVVDLVVNGKVEMGHYVIDAVFQNNVEPIFVCALKAYKGGDVGSLYAVQREDRFVIAEMVVLSLDESYQWVARHFDISGKHIKALVADGGRTKLREKPKLLAVCKSFFF